ncbi:hypothetical protein SAMN04487894_1169 [Niabella drilacis]|uniref:Uncharacterized protein n=1 Tax=Niabella drilacis (strain DSM 25811 / CCM 8410 / CCUG 62505 / LMG 26954 / E90) TaxID=1285928 RepID=A0A1G6YME9_NIADE|nr:hypothetical protein SAMN04487894_1169 [Niabella drilacis]
MRRSDHCQHNTVVLPGYLPLQPVISNQDDASLSLVFYKNKAIFPNKFCYYYANNNLR